MLKVYKISAKKVQRSYVSWYWSATENLKKNRFASKITRIWWILIQALKVSKISTLHFKLWPKTVQRSYLSWQWRVMQNLKKNWLVVWKMTWGNWQIFNTALESLKVGTFMVSFCPKLKMYEITIYRWVMNLTNFDLCSGKSKKFAL